MYRENFNLKILSLQINNLKPISYDNKLVIDKDVSQQVLMKSHS